MKIFRSLAAVSAVLVLLVTGTTRSFACTNLLVGSAASSDGSTFLTYNMDSYGMCAKLRLTPGGSHARGEMVQVYDHDNHVHLGEIPQVSETYRVVGFINEKQLSIVETTWGGRTGQNNPDGLLHYTELIELGLERAATAREAIKVMTDLVAKYGYVSTGETFSIADTKEVWIMEMIGKGADEKGAVWVAIRVPDDCICAHANQSRIHKFDRSDKANVMYAKDVISYARKKGFFTGKDEDFDFSKAYSPTSFHMQRACEARVWSIFNMFSDDFSKYIATVDGLHLDDYEEMPLFIRPNRKVSLKDAMNVMRDHYEGTPFDMTTDMSGGPWNSPYRPRPQDYTIDGISYYHERPISTQQSACTVVCQMRGSMPDATGGVLWFGNDDANMVTYTPVYCCATRVPDCYNDPDATDTNFSWNSAFWVCNWVSNMVYPRYSILMPKLLETREELQDKYIAQAAQIESGAADAEALTAFGEACASEMLSRWKDLGVHLIVMYNDMALKPEKDGEFLLTPEGRGVSPERNGYNDMYRRAIATCTADRYYSGELTFVQITDPQIGFCDETKHFTQTDDHLRQAVEMINGIDPACVIVTGDLTDDWKNAEQTEIYTKWMSQIDSTIPVFITPGNHDVKYKKPETLKRYNELVGYMRFSFVKGDCVFIGFDSNCIQNEVQPHEQEQYEWLEQELQKAQALQTSTGKKHIFLFCHCPIVWENYTEDDNHNAFPKTLRDKYLNLFTQYGVEAICTGHSHNGRYIELNGIRCINANPVAAAIGGNSSGIYVYHISPAGFTYDFQTIK